MNQVTVTEIVVPKQKIIKVINHKHFRLWFCPNKLPYTFWRKSLKKLGWIFMFYKFHTHTTSKNTNLQSTIRNHRLSTRYHTVLDMPVTTRLRIGMPGTTTSHLAFSIPYPNLHNHI